MEEGSCEWAREQLYGDTSQPLTEDLLAKSRIIKAIDHFDRCPDCLVWKKHPRALSTLDIWQIEEWLEDTNKPMCFRSALFDTLGETGRLTCELVRSVLDDFSELRIVPNGGGAFLIDQAQRHLLTCASCLNYCPAGSRGSLLEWLVRENKDRSKNN